MLFSVEKSSNLSTLINTDIIEQKPMIRDITNCILCCDLRITQWGLELWGLLLIGHHFCGVINQISCAVTSPAQYLTEMTLIRHLDASSSLFRISILTKGRFWVFSSGTCFASHVRILLKQIWSHRFCNFWHWQCVTIKSSKYVIFHIPSVNYWHPIQSVRRFSAIMSSFIVFFICSIIMRHK